MIYCRVIAELQNKPKVKFFLNHWRADIVADREGFENSLIFPISLKIETFKIKSMSIAL